MLKQIKVLMFGWEFPPHNSGGLGVACKGLSQALAQENIHITFVLPKRVDVSSSSENMNIIFADIPNVEVTGIQTLLYPYITSEQYIRRYQELDEPTLYGVGLFEEVRRYALCIRKLAAEENFDVIHAHDWLSILAGVEAKRVSGKPLIIHVHATEFDRTGNGHINQNVYDIERKGMKEADAIIAVSDFTKNIIIHHYGINSDKITVVHNGIEAHEYKENHRNDMLHLKKRGYKMVLFVGRLTVQKGPDYFLRAAKKVLDHYSNVYFVIAGSGDMERQIIHEAASLGISDKVLFAGFVRGDELNTLYCAADLYVLPSVSEPFGITPLESLANSTPVLLSKQSGVSEVLTHALKVDFWDVDEMANMIVSVLRNDVLRHQLIKYGKNEAVHLTWKKSAQKCAILYQKILTVFNATKAVYR